MIDSELAVLFILVAIIAGFVGGIIIGALATRGEWRTDEGYDNYHRSKGVWYKIAYIGNSKNLPFDEVPYGSKTKKREEKE